MDSVSMDRWSANWCSHGDACVFTAGQKVVLAIRCCVVRCRRRDAAFQLGQYYIVSTLGQIERTSDTDDDRCEYMYMKLHIVHLTALDMLMTLDPQSTLVD